METGFSALGTTTPESYGRPIFCLCFAFWNFVSKVIYLLFDVRSSSCLVLLLFLRPEWWTNINLTIWFVLELVSRPINGTYLPRITISIQNKNTPATALAPRVHRPMASRLRAAASEFSSYSYSRGGSSGPHHTPPTKTT